MSILLVVQAGHDGTDSKQRQLAPFADSSVLDVALGRLAGYDDGPVVLAISDLPDDDDLEQLARSHNLAVVRGPSDDLLARFVEVIADYPAEHLARVSVESPLIDASLVADVVAAHVEAGADYTSNTLLRTHPAGLDVEVIRSDSLLDAAEQASAGTERTGVTTFVHRRPAEYVLHAAIAAGDYEDHDWRAGTDDQRRHLNELLSKSGGDLGKPWDFYLGYDRPGSSDAPVRLRVARDNVAAAVPEFAETIGFPPDPFPRYDPNRRSWGVWNGEDLIGAVIVSVQNGWGTLAGHFRGALPGGLADATLAALDDRLLADDQVVALTVDGSKIRTYRD